jgi:hypothetical protein
VKEKAGKARVREKAKGKKKARVKAAAKMNRVTNQKATNPEKVRMATTLAKKKARVIPKAISAAPRKKAETSVNVL